jgi:hypothetical protein
MIINNYQQFLLESENEDTRLVDFFASISRNYESQRPFYTDQLQFVVEEERRDWRDTRKYVELEKTVTHEASYKIKFKMDEKLYLLEIEFDFNFEGRKERDAPEAMAQDDEERLNIVLQKIGLKKIKIHSTTYNITKSGKEITPPVKKACEAFLVKMMEVDYDTLGEEIYKIEHS